MYHNMFLNDNIVTALQNITKKCDKCPSYIYIYIEQIIIIDEYEV